jgi:prepilin-type N-terminal cleavage/methylation domain-containing protein
MSSTKTNFNQKGFTLVELVITITVISILAVIGYVAYGGMQTRAREAIVRSDLASAVDILNVDKARSGGTAYPDDIDNADRGNGLPASDGTSYQYTVNNAVSPPTFCLTAINDTVAMYISEASYPQSGVCSGHTGI